MSKQSLLLVDGDTRSLRVLEVSLRKAGFSVTAALTVRDALDKLELNTPDLIISETSFAAELDGFELRRRVRGEPELAEIPFIFLTAETAIANKIRGLELGVDDYLTKPIYIKEIVTRINILLQKRQRRGFDDRKDGTRFAGRVTDMPVVDVIQTIEISRKSGVINFIGERGRQAAIYFRDGRVIDAEAGTLQGEDAVYRLLTWSDGEFEVMFRTVRRREQITASSQGLLMEGMRRLDEWSRLLEQLPPLTHRFEVDAHELSSRLGEIPDDNNRILRLIDGKRSLIEVIDGSDFGDLECLQAVSRLYFEGLLIDLDPHERPKRDTGKLGPLEVVEDVPTPIEEVASGPIAMQEHHARSSVVAPPPPTEVVEEVVEEQVEDVASDAIEEETPIPGPLMGGYRPSSLMLIDAAVAAAEAIDPFFIDLPPGEALDDTVAVARVKVAPRPVDPRIAAARDLVERTQSASDSDDEAVNGSPSSVEVNPSHATALEADEPPPTDEGSGSGSEDISHGRRFAATIRREDSGLRMIGSHGRDRAEASGELAQIADPTPSPEVEPHRELVTILPRRITREIPTAQVAEAASAALAATSAPVAATAAPVATTAAPVAATAAPVAATAAPAKPVEPVAKRRMLAIVAGGTRARGPGMFARSLLVAASLLTATAVFMKCRKHPAKSPVVDLGSDAVGSNDHVPMPSPVDAAVASSQPRIDAHVVSSPRDAAIAATPKPDARIAVVEHRDAAIAAAPKPDARIAEERHDAAVIAVTPKPDAGDGEPVHRDAGVAATSRDAAVVVADKGDKGDKAKEAKDLLQKATEAIDEGDYEKAITLADASIKLRKTAKTYLVKAQALQRLSRVDDALKALDSATEIFSEFAPAWELRGMMLWSAGRRDEARAAMTRYLELDPTGKSASAMRKLLQEPQ